MDPSRTDVDGEDGWLTAEQVAGILGVKRATVYAYVSRGQLHRKVALDGRTSLFDRREVEDLRRGRRPETPGELRTILTTGITRIGESTVLIRGHDLIEAVARGWGFADVAELIWESSGGELFDHPVGPVDEPVAVKSGSEDLLMLDRLRIAVCLASSADPIRLDLSPTTVRRTARRLIRAMIRGLPPLTGGEGEPHEAESGEAESGDEGQPPARALWTRLTRQRPTVERVRCLDVAMALLADHGLATSTFAARIAASTKADPYSVVLAGLGVVGGPLHGAASAGVHQILDAVESHDDALKALGAAQREHRVIPGYGHTVYRRVDPRYTLLHRLVTDTWQGDRRLDHFAAYQDAVNQRTEAAPNVDLALGLLTYLADMAPGAGEVIFAVARTAGWLGHAMEEYGEKPLRLRPKGHYIGPDRLHNPQP